MAKKECEIILEAITGITDDASQERREHVAADLERMSYEPNFIIPVDGFLHMDRNQIISTAQKVFHMPEEEILELGLHYSKDPERIRCDQLKMLSYYYQLLSRLRADEAEAWDEIHELYEDD
jgi:hypothetical protein